MSENSHSIDPEFGLLAAYNNRHRPPEYVNNTAVADLLPHDDLRAEHYADPVSQNYPAHTKAAVFVSQFYYLANTEESQRAEDMQKSAAYNIQGNLDKQASYFGITKDIEDLKTRFSEWQNEKESLDNADFCVVETIQKEGKEETVRLYPVRDNLELYQAREYFLNHQQDMPLPMRRKFASNLIRLGDKYGCPSNPNLECRLQQFAGQGFYDKNRLKSAIRDTVGLAARRMDIDEKRAIQSKVTSLCENIDESPELNQKQAFKEQLVDFLSKMAKIGDAEIRPPEEVVFELPESALHAFANDLVQLPTGSIYRSKNAKQMDLDRMSKLFGDDFVNDIMDGLEINPQLFAKRANSLPLSEARLLDDLMKEEGHVPIGGNRKSAFTKLELDSLLKQAADSKAARSR